MFRKLFLKIKMHTAILLYINLELFLRVGMLLSKYKVRELRYGHDNHELCINSIKGGKLL